jgi:hypothetical protein
LLLVTLIPPKTAFTQQGEDWLWVKLKTADTVILLRHEMIKLLQRFGAMAAEEYGLDDKSISLQWKCEVEEVESYRTQIVKGSAKKTAIRT